MNAQNQSKTGLNSGSFLLCVAVVLLVGCSSLNRRQNDIAASGMQTAAEEVDAEGRCLELTLGALRELVNQPGPDLKQPFHHFSVALDRLTSAARRTENTGRRMQARNAAYLSSWDKQLAAMEYAHVREVSQARRTEVSARCDALNQRYQENQSAVEPLISYLYDIRKALEADLTANGLDALKSVVQNADQNAAKVQTALAALTTELTNSGTRMASIVTPNQPEGP
jgi:hypothetical protein